MSQSQLWDDVDDYFTTHLAPEDDVLRAALRDSEAAGLPSIAVTAPQGKLLQLLAQIQGARSILELGTLGGYSTIWLARALPADGKLVSLEYEAKHAEVARRNVARAGFADRVDIRVGRGVDLLPGVDGPIDFAFIDADKASNPEYFEGALNLSRPGGLIVVDNVVRGGGVTNADGDANIQGIRKMFEMIAKEPRVEATAVQTVGSKGWDGFCLIRVKG